MPLPAAETVGHRTAALLCRWPPQQRGAGASRAAAALLARARFPQYSNQAQRRQQRQRSHCSAVNTVQQAADCVLRYVASLGGHNGPVYAMLADENFL